MNIISLQRRLTDLGKYVGVIDGLWGPMTRDAIMAALTDGPDLSLTDTDVAQAAETLNVTPAHIWTVWDVEASGSPFIDGRPTILFEPHRFSKATAHRYDYSHPLISSANWNKKLYPGSQAGRYEQLLQAVELDVDAGFASASYGGFQILGENYAVCGAISPWSFAWQEAQTEADQLTHFVAFVNGNGLADALRSNDWARFARSYNGAAYAVNKYDQRLAAAYKKRGGK